MEAEPRVLDLTGWDLQKVIHAYGTNGIITEVEMPLAPPMTGSTCIVGFDDFMEACASPTRSRNADGLLFKEIAPVAAPVPHDYFLRHQPYIRQRPVDRRADGRAALPWMPFLPSSAAQKGEILFRSDTVGRARRACRIYELTWNHTTLRGLRVDPSITYLQVHYPFPDHVANVRKMTEIFGDEVPGHLEFIRFDGKIVLPACRSCASPPRSGSTRSSGSTRTMAARSSIRTATRWRKAA